MLSVRFLGGGTCVLGWVLVATSLAGDLSLRTEPWGRMPDGRPVSCYALADTNGLRARILAYGAILQTLAVPDREGRCADVVLGFDDLDSYVQRNPLFGAVVGRYANRIAGARFVLDGREVRVTANAGQHHIHGGARQRFDKVLWQAASFRREHAVGVRLSHISPAGSEGFPGTLDVAVTYTLTDRRELRIDYAATTDAPTVFNVTNHSYFNLAGAGSGDILAHVLQVEAPWYTPADAARIPTGEVRAVTGSPLDFRAPRALGERIGQLAAIGGYDHNLVLSGPAGQLRRAARLVEPGSGRRMTLWTTEPGLQLYTANGLRDRAGKAGRRYGRYGGVCLETQHFPDSPNRAHFPSTVLRPDRPFRSTTVFQFDTVPSEASPP